MGFHCTSVYRVSHLGFCKRWMQSLCSLRTVRTGAAMVCDQRRTLRTAAQNHTKCSQTQRLTHRTLIRLSGDQTSEFLQGLLTNDMMCLNPGKVDCARTLYTLMLNVQGRVLYDMILYAVEKQKSKDAQDAPLTELFMECDVAVVEELMKTLKRYKIRKKVNIAPVGDEYIVWSVLPPGSDDDTGGGGQSVLPSGDKPPGVSLSDPTNVLLCEPDPRLKALGYRLLLPAGISASSVLASAEETDSLAYVKHRYRLGVAEGSIELPPGACLPLESNAAFLNGVSFKKGCYIGQELTARTFHTGLTRKRIMPLALDSELEDTSTVTVKNGAGKKCGTLRGHCGVLGLALLRLPDTVGKGPLTLRVGEKEERTLTTVSTHIPTWWPLDTDSLLKQITTDYPKAVPPKPK